MKTGSEIGKVNANVSPVLKLLTSAVITEDKKEICDQFRWYVYLGFPSSFRNLDQNRAEF